jgi:hypothetical protein
MRPGVHVHDCLLHFVDAHGLAGMDGNRTDLGRRVQACWIDGLILSNAARTGPMSSTKAFEAF